MNTAFKLSTSPLPLAWADSAPKVASSIDKTSNELIRLFGWQDLPAQIFPLIKEDLRSFSREILEFYTVIDPEVQARKKRVNYWIKQYLCGNCSVHLLEEMLA